MQMLQLVLWCFFPLLVAAKLENDTLLWGPYRPNLYFGLRPRIPQSLMTGLMWFGTQDYQSIGKTRHACDQGDGITNYTWTEYDAREGGVQTINDGPNNVKITTEFFKVAGGNHGGSWAARIKGEPINDARPSRISTIFYFGMEGLGALDMDTEEDENGLDGEVKLSGSTPELDEFTIRIVDDPSNSAPVTGNYASQFEKRNGKTHFLGQPVPSGNIWQAKEVLLQNIIKRAQDILAPFKDATTGPPDPSFVLQFSNEAYTGSNLYAIQKIFDGEFQFDVFFESASSKHHLSASTINEGIPALTSAYHRRFQDTFPFPSDYHGPNQDSMEKFSKAVTSNLMAGVGYFYGTSIVNRKFSYEWDEEENAESNNDEGASGAKLTEPRALLTATPSRSFFPRGFYWDEGFHLLHIGAWDSDFSLEILRHWIDLIDSDGWVAREQILGEEARSKVPAEFQTQVPNYANPPTLTMAVTAYIARVKKAAASSGPSVHDLGMELGSQLVLKDSSSSYLEPETALSFLKSIYGPLKRHYNWFRSTQRGQIKQYGRVARSRTEGYRWRGRSEQHVLTSGMDDYPRGPPHPGELHLDLISWMAFFSQTMKDIAEFVGENDDAASFAEIEQAILGNVDDLHWNQERRMYCDLNVDSDDESYHVCHAGYLSMFPLLLGLLPPTAEHLGPMLDMLRDPDQLWSPYGLRSLSASHPEFGQGENYWKGPIWIQMNYLALRSLFKVYAKEEGPYRERAQQIYHELRKNIINNVFEEYQRTGYVWEQYDSTTGKGMRSHPFTGWTSLVTLILAETY
ncbi:Mannosyl-oligosaccharide glucosidase [Mycena indigotica]|uniref:Mannosyl-oligosaccharide glucosidase n=1 Tax=Mycena indigotica TaxID=2126181 RepID=A0A8H6S8U7_9AGAR|nr:Mannosyl-oligosaccharide glucosidase [Mycena indigotica]KAF7295130.1 Mannosyl-oligosaccharide glucosidase [Mycena indigotica]